MKQWILYLPMVLALTACRGSRADDSDGRAVITVTVEPLRYFTEAIAGDRFRVVSMVPHGSSPETYDPTPQQLVELNRSAAYLRVGYIGFEQVWMKRLKENAPQLPFFDMSEGVELIRDTTHHHAHHAHEEGHEHAQGVEPHIWNSPVNAQIIAANVLKALRSIDNDGAAFYAARYDSLCRRIAHVDSLLCAHFRREDADRTFLIYHPALSYFARDYDLQQIAIEEGGKEPSPVWLQQLIARSREKSVHVIFVQPEFDRRNAEVIARQTGARIVPINPLAYDWEAELIHTANSLTK
ncbi:MAG: zinc ABC transporter substrate-binding protein [Prevotellaceae bacterium]|jgi:zinc transport system substrate-binding protein|nr:zinc ABC transporter substrate-binding protein [Prevotellaceae bacterium]